MEKRKETSEWRDKEKEENTTGLSISLSLWAKNISNNV